MKITFKEIKNDVLRISTTLNNREYVAFGWISATKNHFPPECYKEDGHRFDNAEPREMTEQEKQAYGRQLLTSLYEELADAR